jgi:hypothetical protein
VDGTGLGLCPVARRIGKLFANPAALESHGPRVSLPTNETDHSCMLILQLGTLKENVYFHGRSRRGAWHFKNHNKFGLVLSLQFGLHSSSVV